MNYRRRQVIVLSGSVLASSLAGCIGESESGLIYIGSLDQKNISVAVTVFDAESGNAVIDEQVTIESTDPSDSVYVDGEIQYGGEYRIEVTARKNKRTLQEKSEVMPIYEGQTISILVSSDVIDISRGEE
jgi:hypothetical protein